jgi:SAM-dependent methyltransferase
VLNLLGASVPGGSLYMMDGARRIAASALAHKKKIDIILLVAEKEYAGLLKKGIVNQLRKRIRELGWFHGYQSFPLIGLKGERSTRRFELMDMSLLRDQVVYDFGCNLGQSCLKAVMAGAKKAVGFDVMADSLETAETINTLSGFKNLRYFRVDFNHPRLEETIDRQFPEPCDYSFFFSVYRTKELIQRDRLFRYIINKSRKGIFFEGHAHPRIDTIEYYDWLFDTFQMQYQFLGYSEGDVRPLFFLNTLEP